MPKRLSAVNYYHKALHLGCCSSPRSDAVIDKEILYENQFSFQAAHYTEHAILQLTSHIEAAFNSGKFTFGIFIDFSKAFDTVDRSILVKKLEKCGIKNQNLKWFI